MHILTLIFCFVVLTYYNPHVQAQQLDDKFIPQDVADGDLFGGAISISGNRALVGSSGDYAGQLIYSGAAYIFELNNGQWIESAKLVPSERADLQFFGTQVSLQGNRALISALSDGNLSVRSPGAVYVFEFDGVNWIETDKLFANDGESFAEFGISISQYHDRVMVGAWKDGSQEIGAVYVFDYDGNDWQQSDKITADDPNIYARFGAQVVLDNNRALISSINDFNSNVFSGSVYVYEYNDDTWQQTDKLLPDPLLTNTDFGVSISLSNDIAWVGEAKSPALGVASGAAYVYTYDGNTWSQQQKLTANDGSADDRFGSALVHLNNDTVFIGAPGHSPLINGPAAGAVYVFENQAGNWSSDQKISAADATNNQQFGSALYTDGVYLLSGAPQDIEQNISGGSVYFLAGLDLIFANGFD
ncbi:hypothetical protein [Marinicella sp. W31]|uniref:hypothetical protein n=1 Tax=Marinicella sp. W31 TaxID=3023713 RepID=UPI0037579EFB